MRSTAPLHTVRATVARAVPAALVTGVLLLGAIPGPVAAATDATTPTGTTVLTGSRPAASWSGPLSTRGRYIVDANGNRFKLKASNWAGAQGNRLGSGDVDDPANNQSGQVSHNIPLGLDRAPIARITADFHALGLNAIRLPFANAMVHDTTAVPDSAVAANPQLKGKTPLQVYDAVVEALTADGFAVILNNHTTTYRWCCALDGNERWNSGQTTRQWIDDWLSMVDRYKANKRVVGADLRNEVRRDWYDDPNWGWGNGHDLYAAFEEAGNKILEADPDMLVIMEGINWYGIPSGITSHGRPTLTPVRNLSNTLVDSGKLVYSAHFYGYTGPNHTGATGGWQNGETNDPRYQDLTPEQLARVVDDEALFVTQAGQHFTAPVWISEFGAGGRGSDNVKEKAWFDNFTDILVKNDTDFAQWPVIGWTTHGVPNDNWALISYDSSGKRLGLTDPGDWRATDWFKLIDAPSVTGPIDQVDHWNMLDTDFGDQNASKTMPAKPDWHPNNRKGNCPDTQRLVALSRLGHRALCTDANQPAKAAGDWVLVTDERYVTHGDWAGGYSKFECPDNHFVVGFSVNGTAMSGLLCAPSAKTLSTDRRVLWFDRGDNRPTTGGAVQNDWAPHDYKGQCADNEYLAGVAYTWNLWQGGWSNGQKAVPDALLCRPLT